MTKHKGRLRGRTFRRRGDMDFAIRVEPTAVQGIRIVLEAGAFGGGTTWVHFLPNDARPFFAYGLAVCDQEEQENG